MFDNLENLGGDSEDSLARLMQDARENGLQIQTIPGNHSIGGGRSIFVFVTHPRQDGDVQLAYYEVEDTYYELGEHTVDCSLAGEGFQCESGERTILTGQNPRAECHSIITFPTAGGTPNMAMNFQASSYMLANGGKTSQSVEITIGAASVSLNLDDFELIDDSALEAVETDSGAEVGAEDDIVFDIDEKGLHLVESSRCQEEIVQDIDLTSALFFDEVRNTRKYHLEGLAHPIAVTCFRYASHTLITLRYQGTKIKVDFPVPTSEGLLDIEEMVGYALQDGNLPMFAVPKVVDLQRHLAQ